VHQGKNKILLLDELNSVHLQHDRKNTHIGYSADLYLSADHLLFRSLFIIPDEKTIKIYEENLLSGIQLKFNFSANKSEFTHKFKPEVTLLKQFRQFSTE